MSRSSRFAFFAVVFALLMLFGAGEIFAPAGAIRRVLLLSLVLSGVGVIRGAMRLGTHGISKVYIVLVGVGCLLVLVSLGLASGIDVQWLLLAGVNLLVIGAIGYSVYFSRRIVEDIRDQK